MAPLWPKSFHAVQPWAQTSDPLGQRVSITGASTELQNICSPCCSRIFVNTLCGVVRCYLADTVSKVDNNAPQCNTYFLFESWQRWGMNLFLFICVCITNDLYPFPLNLQVRFPMFCWLTKPILFCVCFQDWIEFLQYLHPLQTQKWRKWIHGGSDFGEWSLRQSIGSKVRNQRGKNCNVQAFFCLYNVLSELQCMHVVQMLQSEMLITVHVVNWCHYSLLLLPSQGENETPKAEWQRSFKCEFRRVFHFVD